MLRGCKKLIFGLTLTVSLVGVSLCFAEDLPLQAKAKALAHYIMAVSHDLNSETSLAISGYEHSVSYDPTQAAPHLRLGAYYARMGLLEEAEKQLNAVVANDPKRVEAHYLLALVYSSQKKFDLAAKSYESILKYASENNPNNIEVHTYLAQLYYSQRKYPQAIEQFSKIISAQPKNISALYTLGNIYLETNERGKAKEIYRQVLAIEPGHDGALNSLAYMCAQDNEHIDEALKMARKAVELDPSNGAYYDTLGWVLYRKELYAEALMSLQKAEGLIKDAVIYEHMADVYMAVKEYALARKFCKKSLELNPHQPQVLQKLQQLEKTQASKEN